MCNNKNRYTFLTIQKDRNSCTESERGCGRNSVSQTLTIRIIYLMSRSWGFNWGTSSTYWNWRGKNVVPSRNRTTCPIPGIKLIYVSKNSSYNSHFRYSKKKNRFEIHKTENTLWLAYQQNEVYSHPTMEKLIVYQVMPRLTSGAVKADGTYW